MIAAVVLIGEDQADRIGPLALVFFISMQHLAVIIVIHDGNIALAFENTLGLRPIISLRASCHVADKRIGPGLGHVFAIGCDNRGQKRAVVNMATLASANPAFPHRIGQFLDIRNGVSSNTVLRCHQEPCSGR